MGRSTGKALAVPGEPGKAELLERLTALGAAANRNDAKAQELLAFCRAHPEAWTMIQGLEQDAVDCWLQLLAPGAHGDAHKAAWKREHIAQELKRRRSELLADGRSQLEVLLANRVLSAWLMTTEADAGYARWMHAGGTFREGEYHQKRLDRAQRQLLRAVQSLATVRRLLTPVQVNIGHNQVNVAG